MENHQTTPPGTETPWIFEPSGDDLYRVVNVQGVVLAERCVSEEAALFAASWKLLAAAKLAVDTMMAKNPDWATSHDALQVAIAEAEGR